MFRNQKKCSFVIASYYNRPQTHFDSVKNNIRQNFQRYMHKKREKEQDKRRFTLRNNSCESDFERAIFLLDQIHDEILTMGNKFVLKNEESNFMNSPNVCLICNSVLPQGKQNSIMCNTCASQYLQM